MLVAPYYEPFSIAETKRRHADVAGSVSILVMAITCPPATGVNSLPPSSQPDEVPNISTSCKKNSGDFTAAAQLIHEWRPSGFVGWHRAFPGCTARGSGRLQGGAANVAPAQLVAVYDAVQQGTLPVHAASEDPPRGWSTLSAAVTTPANGGRPHRPPGGPRAPRREWTAIGGGSGQSLAILGTTARGSHRTPTRLRPGAGARVREASVSRARARSPTVWISINAASVELCDRPASVAYPGIRSKAPNRGTQTWTPVSDTSEHTLIERCVK
jgi:hypothetical protein